MQRNVGKCSESTGKAVPYATTVYCLGFGLRRILVKGQFGNYSMVNVAPYHKYRITALFMLPRADSGSGTC